MSCKSIYISDYYRVDECFDDEEIIGYVRSELSPEEVFDRKALEEWAKSSGLKEED